MSIPHPLPSRMPHPSQSLGDRLDVEEMSVASSLEDEELHDPGREILVMTVDLGRDMKDKLIVREHDVPRELAETFCRKHGLNERLCSALTLNIESNLNQMLFEQKADSSQVSMEELPSSVTPKPFNYRHFVEKGRKVGDRLYQKGIQQRGLLGLQALRARQQRNLAASRELTFTPQITKKGGSQQAKSDEALWLQAQTAKRVIESKRRDVFNAQAAECTFSPAICPRSDELEQKRSREWSSRFERLYRQAGVQHAKAEQMIEEHFRTLCPFHPELDTFYEEGETLNAHIERLYNSRRRIDTALDLERLRKHCTHDPRTGQELFKPRIGRAPTTTRHENISVYEYLHARQPIKTERLQQSSGVEDYIVNKAASEKIYENMKVSRFRELFDALKLDGETSLSAGSCSMQKLSPEVAAVLGPLVTELQQLRETLDFDEFCDSMENLLKVLTPTERAVLLKRPSSDPSLPSQRLSLPSHSKRSESNGLLSDLPVYEREMLYKKMQEDRLREKKEQCESELAAECSFRPSINASRYRDPCFAVSK